MRILFIGEIVTKTGVFCVKSLLSGLRSELNPDLVIANVDSATGGFGIGRNHAVYLHKLGVDVLTGGDQIYFKKDMVNHISGARYMLRPANLPPNAPGRGRRTFDTVGGAKVVVISLLGQSGFDRVHGSNPYTYLPELTERAREETPFVVVDFHAVTTAEKITMFHHIDGLVSAVIGTGTRVQTADAVVMPKGTAVITDAGRTGSLDSVGGLDPGPEIRKLLTQVPERSSDTWLNLELQGVVIDLNEKGMATSIEAIRVPCKEKAGDGDGSDYQD